MTGVVYRVSTWLISSPPTMLTPSGLRSSLPVPPSSASGRPPRSAAKLVIMMGRNRRRQAFLIDSRGESFSSRSATSAKSIIMIAFFFTMPMRRTMPISATMSNSIPHTISASSAPTPAEGSVERMVIGWM